MQTLYPDYYAQFRCTADKCPITCCQEWKISVDDGTLKRWAALNPPVDSKLFTYVQDGQHVIALNSRHVCPFLEKNKLCRLVLEHGEDAISETCQVFPREIHSFADHEEASLMPCCPAVIDLWAAQDATPLTFPRPDIDPFCSHRRHFATDRPAAGADSFRLFLYDTGNPPKKKADKRLCFRLFF